MKKMSDNEERLFKVSNWHLKRKARTPKGPQGAERRSRGRPPPPRNVADMMLRRLHYI